MDLEALIAPDAGSPLGQSRAQVLDILRRTGSPLGVREIAGRTGLHPNTARFHLDGLAEAGLATREPQARATPGRPSMVYRAVESGRPAGARRYRLLAEMLTSLIAGMMPEPGKAAARAGREWGAYLTERPPPYQRMRSGEAIERLTAIMAELGFAPQAAADGKQYRLCLRQCPFLEVAELHQDVVCSLHLGLMQGVLAQLGAPVTTDRLQPFAEPSLCIAHLTARDESGNASPATDAAR
ncbi:MAG TPA: helix-turn-helix domain-containing protein [Streptosporangiaceae bacterium]|nr:helix-turn-helix domain-containing protein [Streptosporangiaceae bacterium]